MFRLFCLMFALAGAFLTHRYAGNEVWVWLPFAFVTGVALWLTVKK